MDEKVNEAMELIDKLRSKVFDIAGDDDVDHSDEMDFIVDELRGTCNLLGIA